MELLVRYMYLHTLKLFFWYYVSVLRNQLCPYSYVRSFVAWGGIEPPLQPLCSSCVRNEYTFLCFINNFQSY